MGEPVPEASASLATAFGDPRERVNRPLGQHILMQAQAFLAKLGALSLSTHSTGSPRVAPRPATPASWGACKECK